MRWSAFFFFQAEDGIRDLTVTGVQTCALPIFLDWYTILVGLAAFFALAQHGALWLLVKTAGAVQERARRIARVRSEERRVGKGVDLGGRRIIKKKKQARKRSRDDGQSLRSDAR